MNKVGFFRSIHFKFVMVYVLLIMIAMQIIGVYFVQQLERSLTENFNTSITQRINFINYSIEQEMSKERTEDPTGTLPTLEEDITAILKDFAKDEIQEIRVIDKNSRVIATSDPNNSDIIGKRTTEVLVKRTLVFEKPDEKVYIDKPTSRRVKISSTPIKNINQETIGALYLVASMEEVFSQMRVINGILATGTGISLAITALLGVFLARTITRPMSDMRKQALELAKGTFLEKSAFTARMKSASLR